MTRLNQILGTNGIKFPAASTPYEKLAALFEKSKGVISKSDLVGWHVGRYFNEPTSSDAKRAVFIGAIADEVKDGGPIFGKVLKVSAIPLRDYEKEEAMSPEVINNVMERFIQNNAAVYPGLKVTYDIKPKESLGSLVTIHAEIRKLGKYLILKQDEISINDGVFYAKGIYKSTIYAYFFKDVTPKKTNIKGTSGVWADQDTGEQRHSAK